MNVLRGSGEYQLSLLHTHTSVRRRSYTPPNILPFNHARKSLTSPLKACTGGEDKQTKRRSFLTLEEAGLVEMTGLSSHERFLCRLTISSLNLLRVVAEQEGCAIEDLNAGRVCDWFLKDKLKREQNLDSAILQWDESEFGI